MNTFHYPATRWSRLPVFLGPFPRLVNDLLGPQGEATETVDGRPMPMNVWSDEKALHIEAEVPGLAIEDIELTVLEDELTLKGKSSSAPVLDEKSTLLLEERRAGAFDRRLRLPFEVQADAVTAELRNGVLMVTLPRSEADQPRRITVRSASK